jgi:hypothetical protein
MAPQQTTASTKVAANPIGRFFDRARKYVIMTMLATVCGVGMAQVKANPLAFLDQVQRMEHKMTNPAENQEAPEKKDEEAEMERMEEEEGMPSGGMQQFNMTPVASSKVIVKEGSKTTIKMSKELWETFGKKHNLI